MCKGKNIYKEKDIVRIAKRENNTKRQYLVVNALQSKHIPTSGVKALEMFNTLADIVKAEYPDQKLLLVGFAETATAIGSALAVALNSLYIQTTREIIENAEYLYFSESHSHATEQKLVKNDIDSVINDVDRIIFVEDEVTTGNTILNIINLIEKNYPNNIKFSVASILNGMDSNSLEIYNQRGINVHYLVKTDHSTYTEVAQNFRGDGKYIDCNISSLQTNHNILSADQYINARRITDGKKYNDACNRLFEQVKSKLQLTNNSNILVLGTEEFMYPAIFVATQLEKQGNKVLCHSTTRSPITVSSEENYPVHSRYTLKSLYDSNRTTFIYDLQKYDKVLIVTDVNIENENMGLNSLINALEQCGNNDINVIRWY